MNRKSRVTLNCCLPFENIRPNDAPRVGGKGFTLAQLKRDGAPVPPGCCLPTDLYVRYVQETDLRERIALELNRKPFEDMRWEEIWDASLRIRNLFLKTSLPPLFYDELHRELTTLFSTRPVAVRSSAPGEDAANTSFAGLHESFVNVVGPEMIIDRVILVWASLWSDAALLYRKELALDITASTMAVVVQEFISGECSGVVFSQHPQRSDQAVIEAVWGLNQGLVDGTVEPDRWIVDKMTGETAEIYHPVRTHSLIDGKNGITLSPLSPAIAGKPPLEDSQVKTVYQLALQIEHVFQCPQDLEWTFRDRQLYLLQSRPITTALPENRDDKRTWYLSLRRNVDDLRSLRQKIEHLLLPRMVEESTRFDHQDPATLSDQVLAREIRERKAKLDHWTSVYWEDFIPFAHGVRLFGQFYNDTVRPDDPFEFVDLLQEQPLESMKRNALLTEIAQQIQQIDPEALQAIIEGSHPVEPSLVNQIDQMIRDSGVAFLLPDQLPAMLEFFQEFADHALAPRQSGDRTQKVARFLNAFSRQERETVEALLDLARTSYRLRDDDNIYLGRFEQALEKTLSIARKRLETLLPFDPLDLSPDELIQALEHPAAVSKPSRPTGQPRTRSFSIRSRQITGQPASAGVATGSARVISGPLDLFSFRNKEILVCDAIDPTMTFLVPLCSAIVERRGGMLIHGAIIAREYGIPCVTGITDATETINTGSRLTVDGYLGIVTIYGEDADGRDGSLPG